MEFSKKVTTYRATALVAVALLALVQTACDRQQYELLSTPDASAAMTADMLDASTGQSAADNVPGEDASVASDSDPGLAVAFDGGQSQNGVVVDGGPATLRWLSQPDYPLARGGIGAATLNGQIHTLGGDVNYEGSMPSTSHWVYDIDTDTYTSRAATPDTNQWGPCVTASGGYLYSFGGWKGGGGVMRRYDPGTDQWTTLTSSPRKQVWGYACDVVDGVIYVISGAVDPDGKMVTDAVSAYDIASDSWSEKAAFPAKEAELTGAAIGTRIYVVGRGTNLDIYDTVKNAWSTGPSIGRSAARAVAVAYNGSLYVFGGKKANNVDRLDFPSSGPTWTALPPMSSTRSVIAAAVSGNEIHLFGGFSDSDNGVATHEALVVP